MTISHFSAPSNEDLVSLATFPDFGNFSACAVGNKGTGNIVPQQPSPPTTSDGSPDSSAPAPGDSVMLGEDDEDEAESGSEDLNGPKKRHGIGAGASKRGKASSAERRATHNAIERARRESLNGRFLELANALPTMAAVKRPSKSVIVNKSLEWIYESQIREHALVRENNALRAELNDMRARLQMPPLSNPPALPSASDVARFKAAGPAVSQSNIQLGVANGPAATGPIDSYFGQAAAFPALGALHQPMQYAGLPSGPVGPASAPLPRVNGFHFSNPFQTHHGFEVSAGVAQPASPTAKSDSGSETAASTGHGAALHLKNEAGSAGAQTLSSIGDSVLCSTAERSAGIPAVSQADALAALQAAHFQQQQFAAFAAAAAAASQAPQAAPIWPMGGSGTFLF